MYSIPTNENTSCNICKHEPICKYKDNYELTLKAVKDVKKLLEAEHFKITINCPNYEKKNVYR